MAEQRLIRTLKRLMAARGLNQKALALAAGLNETAVRDILQSRIRSPRMQTVAALAATLRVTPAQLMGEAPIGAPPQLLGYVGAGAVILPVDDHEKGAGLADVEMPPGAEGDIVAVRVRGDSMEPAYYNGDVIFYTGHADTPEQFLGRECVVKLADGRLFVKVVQRGTRRQRYNLVSHNAPTIPDQVLEWAAPVRWVRRG